MHEAFDNLYTSDKRYFFLTGGRGSLKSSNVHEFVGNLCRFQKGHGVLFTRYTMTSAEKSIIPEFKAVAKRCGFEHEFDFTKNVVTHKETGSFIFFSGIKTSSGDQTANLKSISGITTWVIEEGEDLKDEKTFETIDDSIRTLTHKNRVIWIMNPTTEEHFIYKKWIAPKSRMIEIDGFNVTVSALPQVEHIHVTYEIGREYLAPDWLAKADRYKKEAFERAALKEDHPRYQPLHKSHYYHNYIGGWLDKAEGVIFDKWSEGAFDYSLPYLYGLDLGYFPDPSAMIAVAVDERLKRIYLKEELYQLELSTSELKAKVKGRLRRVNDYVISEIEPMTVKEIKQHGVNIKQATKGADSVRIGIRKMQGYEIIVDPESENLKTELNNYVWNDKKSDTPIDDYNHLIDASRYGFMELTTKPKGRKRRATTIQMMAENRTQKKKEPKKAEVVWISESAKTQAEALMAHKHEWEQANKARELEAIVVTLANMYPQDQTNILHLMQGNVSLETPKVKKVMKDVPEDNVQRVATTGCDDCGDSNTRQLRFSDLKTEQDIITYFGADKDAKQGLYKMNIMLMENEISESKSVATAAKSLLAMKNKGGYLV